MPDQWITIVTNLISVLISAGITKSIYDRKLNKKEELEKGDSAYRIARITDSASVATMLRDMVEKLTAAEQSWIIEKIELNRDINVLNNKLKDKEIECIEFEEENKLNFNLKVIADGRIIVLEAEKDILIKDLARCRQEAIQTLLKA
jgi:hypothetical protein